MKKEKIIAIVGPTSSGKSDLAVKIALYLKKQSKQPLLFSPLGKGRIKGGDLLPPSIKGALPLPSTRGVFFPPSMGKAGDKILLPYNKGAEIISADSRQVYRGMDIGTGKITTEEMRSIPHHLLDIASPKRRFNVAQFQKKALQTIKSIYKKEKIPIICGGTGFYVQALINGLIIPEGKPNLKLRAKLDKLSTEKLFKKLQKLDDRRAKNIDRNNRRRLIRALEIILVSKKPVPTLKTKSRFNSLIIGIKKPTKKLEKLIKERLLKRLETGMIEEIKKLKKTGVSYKRLEEFGLEYRWVAYYLQQKISYEEMVERLQKKIEQYAKRQITWFKRDQRIHWVKNKKEAFSLVDEFLKK